MFEKAVSNLVIRREDRTTVCSHVRACMQLFYSPKTHAQPGKNRCSCLASTESSQATLPSPFCLSSQKLDKETVQAFGLSSSPPSWWAPSRVGDKILNLLRSLQLTLKRMGRDENGLYMHGYSSSHIMFCIFFFLDPKSEQIAPDIYFLIPYTILYCYLGVGIRHRYYYKICIDKKKYMVHSIFGYIFFYDFQIVQWLDIIRPVLFLGMGENPEIFLTHNYISLK